MRGERPLSRYCEKLGEITVEGLPVLKAGEAKVNVNFSIDESGVLIVEAREKERGIPLRAIIDKSKTRINEKPGQLLLEAARNKAADTEILNKINQLTNRIDELRKKYSDPIKRNEIDDVVYNMSKNENTIDSIKCKLLLDRLSMI